MYWRTYNNEAADSAGTGYVTSEDQAQGTAFTILDGGSSNESVELPELSYSAAYSGLTRKTMIW